MYQGNNKTALSSQRQIADALFGLLEEEPYADISVSAICKRASVSRQTFYSLFRSKDNVVVYLLRKDCCYSPGAGRPGAPYTLRDMCRGFSRYILEQAEIIRLLTGNQITQLLYGSLYDAITDCDCFLAGISPSVRPYAADFIAAGFTSIARIYAGQRDRISAGELEEIIYALFRGRLFPE